MDQLYGGRRCLHVYFRKSWHAHNAHLILLSPFEDLRTVFHDYCISVLCFTRKKSRQMKMFEIYTYLKALSDGKA